MIEAAYGAPCPMCGYPMARGQALDLDHSIPLVASGRSVGDRIVHAKCNRREGGRMRGGVR